MTVTKKNANVSLMLMFLYRLVQVFKVRCCSAFGLTLGCAL